MPIAAVPNYLQQQDPEFYLSAPPGHRFLMYFAAWGENAEKGKADWRIYDRVPRIDKKTKQQKRGNAGPEWEDTPNGQFACVIAACRTPAYDQDKPRKRRPRADPGLTPWKPVMEGLLTRQAKATEAVPTQALLRLDALAVAPFTTGLGNAHPLENGFAFLNPYGLPYLPGSGVKGVVRQAARELASGDWGEAHEWNSERSFTLQAGEDRILLSTLEVLFGLESGDGDTQHVRGALAFWDVIPQIKGDSLMVEIMTPHQGHYYQQDPVAGSTHPHDSGQPTPISYLTVPPESSFAFHVVCDLAFLRRLAPALAENDPATGKPCWQALMTAAFEHAFQWLGFGAKTAVGYGAMRRDAEAEARAEEARAEKEAEAQRQREEAARTARRATLSENEQRIEDFIESARKRHDQLRGGREKPNTGVHSLAQQVVRDALGGDWSTNERRALAEAIEEWLPKLVERFDRKDDWKEARKKLKLQQLKGDSP